MSEIYRDRTEGAAAKRQDLLRRRRDELVTMPHAVRRVVVARTARIAAGMALALAGSALIAIELSPKLSGAMSSVLPGIQPAPASTMLVVAWLLGVVAYMVSRARSEHRFAVAMSRYVLPGSDLDHDIERLDHEHPDEIARQTAHRLEVSSAAWPVLGLALVIPTTLLYVTHAIAKGGWPLMSAFEDSLVVHAKLMLVYGGAGALGALVMTRRSTRKPAAVRVMLAIGFLIALAAVFEHSFTVAVFAIVPVTMMIIIRKLRGERMLIAADDPAAGSEQFTIRALASSIRTSIAALSRRGTPLIRRSFAVGVVMVSVLGWRYAHHVRAKKAAAVAAAMQSAHSGPGPSLAFTIPDDAPYRIKHTVAGAIQIDVDLDGNPVDIPALDDLAQIPAHWHASVTVHIENDAVAVTPFPGGDPPIDLDATHRPSHSFTTDACSDTSQALGLHIEPTHPGKYHVTLDVTPVLSVADCPVRPL